MLHGASETSNMDKESGRRRRSRNRISEIPFSASPVIQKSRRQSFTQAPGPALREGRRLQTNSPSPHVYPHYNEAIKPGTIFRTAPRALDDNLNVLSAKIFAEEIEDPADVTDCETDGPCSGFASRTLQDERANARNASGVSIPSISLKLSSWRVIWALLLTNGSKRLSKEQYQSVRNFSDTILLTGSNSWKSTASEDEHRFAPTSKSGCLPHFSPLHKTFKPLLIDTLAPRGLNVEVPVDESKPGARCSTRSRDGCPEGTVSVILPSEYARLDMATPSVWSEMRSTSLSAAEHSRNISATPSVSSSNCVDIWPIVAARTWFYGFQKAFSVDHTGYGNSSAQFAEVGDTVLLSLFVSIDFCEEMRRCFGAQNAQSSAMQVRGTVSHMLTIHHRSRVDDSDFREEYDYQISPRDKAIASLFGFLDYRSPTDSVSVDVPEIPVQDEGEGTVNDNDEHGANHLSTRKRVSPEMKDAMRRRREAQRERKRQMDTAWKNWVKPILKPGDFVVLLQPCVDHSGRRSDNAVLTSTDRDSRICLVHRFWSEHEERSRHIFWVPGGKDLERAPAYLPSRDSSIHQFCSHPIENHARFHIDVRTVQVEVEHSGMRGPQKYMPVSSVGVLDNGEPYFIYRMLLFWDGFQMQTGKPVSGEGIYMMPLNLPAQARSASAASRILSLTPPGVKSAIILDRILNDIIRGTSEGFVDFDADGGQRRIFLDLVGCVGDTPALNSVLDVMGHTAALCCHMCRFSRGASTLVGSKYTSFASHGFQSTFMRGFYQHTAVHDCDAKEETCRLLGMKHCSRVHGLPSHKFKSSLLAARASCPTTNSGLPVLPCSIDPYRACFVAPDHLLTGHFRDCVCLVLKLLPSREHRVVCEQFMISLLAEAGLPSQNRLVDHEKRVLYSMSMTDLYALAMVAELAFIRGCKLLEVQGTNRTSLSSKCRAAIAIVGSCTNLITAFWRKPTENRDGIAAVRQYELDYGSLTISEIQKSVDAHIAKIEDVSGIPDADTLALEDAQCPRSRKTELVRLQRACIIAIKTVDKPNVHRLRELAYTTLPMLGHVSCVGELVMEKRHQSLKSALKQTNNREVHLLAMKSVAVDDWKGRLSSVIPGVFRRNNSSLLACYRLLAGRESISSCNGNLSSVQQEEVISALGPECCLSRELKSRGAEVLSPRTMGESKAVWYLRDAGVLLDGSTCASNPLLFGLLKRAFKNDLDRFEITLGSIVASSLPNGTPGVLIRCGDIVETLCCKPFDLDFHFPFVVQASCFDFRGQLAEEAGPALWRVKHVFRLRNGGRGTTFYVAVQACAGITDAHFQTELQSGFLQFKIQRSATISIARVDSSMRRVGVLHVCNSNDGNSAQPYVCPSGSRSAQICNSDTFYALTREKGYPPRKG